MRCGGEDLDTQVLRSAQAWHAAGLPVLLATGTRTWGSSPRPPGSLMAINGRGETVGSVSGGCIEDDLIRRVRDDGVQTVCAQGRSTTVCYGVSADQVHRFGLPCDGTGELVHEPLSARSHPPALLRATQQSQSTECRLNLHTGEVTLILGQSNAVSRLSEDTVITPYGPRHRLIVIGAGDLSRFCATWPWG